MITGIGEEERSEAGLRRTLCTFRHFSPSPRDVAGGGEASTLLRFPRRVPLTFPDRRLLCVPSAFLR